MTLADTFLVPLGLGLLGFVEPCTVGSSLLFVKYIEGKSATSAGVETTVFALTRALFIGALGATAALAGPSILPYQRVFWGVLGAAYVAFGALYVTGKHRVLTHRLGPALGGARRVRSAAGLGLLFGLNVPACATPLLAALFAANLGAATLANGFWTMAVFGLGLSLPLVAAVYSDAVRDILDRVTVLAERAPVWIGVTFIALGSWSIYLGAR